MICGIEGIAADNHAIIQIISYIFCVAIKFSIALVISYILIKKYYNINTYKLTIIYW
jgi:hypothetical protein